jgi:hypothetical protein
MARMIPAQPHPDCASEGELALFQRLADAPGTFDWIVLHSLALASHTSPAGGEADFVVIVPNQGVVVLEVKACRSYRYEEGAWYYGRDPFPDRRGPFRQAQEAMWSLRNWVGERRRDLASVLFTSAVVFPFCHCPAVSPEWHPWQLIDAETWGRQPIEESIQSVLAQAARRWHGGPAERRPSAPKERARELAALMRPRFEVFESPQARARRLDAELKHFTEEQFRYLDLIDANPRVLVDGPAGTGKTLLAIEAAQRAARSPLVAAPDTETSGTRQVLVVCFNRLLGAWLREQLGPLRPVVRATTFHRYLLDLLGIEDLPTNADARFWDEELPGRAVQVLQRTPDAQRFDEIILDEAQDLLRGRWLDVLDLSLRGGLTRGRWRAFGDLLNQSLYEAPAAARDIWRERLAAHSVLATLRDNCRNRPRIVEVVNLLANLEPRYRESLRPDDGHNYDLLFHADPDEERAQLAEALTALRAEGFADEDIVVLHPRVQCAAIDAGPLARGTLRFRALSEQGRGAIRHGTVHAFKGLEARAIVLADVADIVGPRARALFYVGATRAQERLVILADSRVKAQLVAQLLGSPKPGAAGRKEDADA